MEPATSNECTRAGASGPACWWSKRFFTVQVQSGALLGDVSVHQDVMMGASGPIDARALNGQWFTSGPWSSFKYGLFDASNRKDRPTATRLRNHGAERPHRSWTLLVSRAPTISVAPVREWRRSDSRATSSNDGVSACFREHTMHATIPSTSSIAWPGDRAISAGLTIQSSNQGVLT